LFRIQTIFREKARRQPGTDTREFCPAITGRAILDII